MKIKPSSRVAVVALSSTLTFVAAASASETAVISSNGVVACGSPLTELTKGVSRYFPWDSSHPGEIHGLFCWGPFSAVSSGWRMGLRLNWSGYYADDRAAPMWLGDNGDWDSGYVKGECDNGSYLNALFTASSSDTSVIGGQCMSIGNFRSYTVDYCHRVDFGNQDVRFSQDGGDWDAQFDKNQCADNEVVKGWSIWPTGKIKSILCCHPIGNP